MSAWGSDVPISKPVVDTDLSDSESVSFQGFAFTPRGITFDLNEAAFQEIYSPTYRPDEFND